MCGINVNLLKSKMVLKGHTQKTLAEKIGIAPVTLTYIFIGRNLPSLGVMRSLVKELKLTQKDISDIFFAE